MAFSIIVPVYNEVESLDKLVELIAASVAQNNLGAYELIFVDDGSRDGSWNKIESLVTAHPGVIKGLRLRRNFGKAAALTAGFNAATGEVIFTMDADLQDDPVELPRFLAKIAEGYDLVSGWKRVRRDPAIHKTIPSRIFNAATRALTGLQLHDFNCGYKAYRAEVAHTLPLYGELHRFIPVFAHAEGFRVGEIEVLHHARKFGKSKYGWQRGLKGVLDLLSVAAMTRFGRSPGHLFGGLGVIVGLIGFLTLFGLWINQLMGHYIEGRPLFFFGILCAIIAVQLLTTGVMAELFLRNTHQSAPPPPLADKKGF